MKVTTTKYGDRWDLLAYDLFGDASLTPVLMAVNTRLISIYDNHIPEGMEVIIPDNIPVKSQISVNCAPWKD